MAGAYRFLHSVARFSVYFSFLLLKPSRFCVFTIDSKAPASSLPLLLIWRAHRPRAPNGGHDRVSVSGIARHAAGRQLQAVREPSRAPEISRRASGGKRQARAAPDCACALGIKRR